MRRESKIPPGFDAFAALAHLTGERRRRGIAQLGEEGLVSLHHAWEKWAHAGQLPPGLAKPALRALYGAGIRSLSDLAQVSRAELTALHGIGPNALATLTRAMAAQRIRFRAR